MKTEEYRCLTPADLKALLYHNLSCSKTLVYKNKLFLSIFHDKMQLVSVGSRISWVRSSSAGFDPQDTAACSSWIIQQRPVTSGSPLPLNNTLTFWCGRAVSWSSLWHIRLKLIWQAILSDSPIIGEFLTCWDKISHFRPLGEQFYSWKIICDSPGNNATEIYPSLILSDAVLVEQSSRFKGLSAASLTSGYKFS